MDPVTDLLLAGKTVSVDTLTNSNIVYKSKQFAASKSKKILEVRIPYHVLFFMLKLAWQK